MRASSSSSTTRIRGFWRRPLAAASVAGASSSRESLGARSRAETPVIFLSAQGDAETKSQGLSLGAADYLAKPFSEQELMARVDRT
ncbi:MAG: response regulator, partial [Myxococcales bacterium]